MKIFTSDLHFRHKRIVEFTNRGLECKSQQEHDKWLIDLWNKEVSAGDTVYHLGDFCFSKNYEEICSILNQLKGQIIMIKGNHDNRQYMNRLYIDGYIAGFFEYKEINIQEIPAVLFHFPISSWHKQGHGSLHLHGHCHGNHRDSHGKMLDVGLDSAYNIFGRHKFFDEHEIVELLKDKQIYIADHHKERVD